MTQPIETLKKGQLFKKPYTADKESNIFRFDGWDRHNRKYAGTRYSNVCEQLYFRKGTQVTTDFTF